MNSYDGAILLIGTTIIAIIISSILFCCLCMPFLSALWQYMKCAACICCCPCRQVASIRSPKLLGTDVDYNEM
jgi:hypothetical protein